MLFEENTSEKKIFHTYLLRTLHQVEKLKLTCLMLKKPSFTPLYPYFYTIKLDLTEIRLVSCFFFTTLEDKQTKRLKSQGVQF